MLPEHDRYNLEFLYSSIITCFDVGPVILYCFLCSPHFVEMPVARPIHFVGKTLCPSTICRGTTPPNFKGYVQPKSYQLTLERVNDAEILVTHKIHPKAQKVGWVNRAGLGLGSNFNKKMRPKMFVTICRNKKVKQVPVVRDILWAKLPSSHLRWHWKTQKVEWMENCQKFLTVDVCQNLLPQMETVSSTVEGHVSRYLLHSYCIMFFVFF